MEASIDGLLGERDRLLGSGREPEIGECDPKRVHDFPLKKTLLTHSSGSASRC